MISEQRLGKALSYLAETDQNVAAAKAYMVGLEGQEKTILATAFLETSGTVAEREAISRTSSAYIAWQEQYKTAVYDYEMLKNKRNTEAMIVEVWRSLNSARTKGVIA